MWRKNGPYKKAGERPAFFYGMSDGLVLVFHLSFDQITQRGRLSLLSLLAVLFDGSSLIHHVLGLDGQRKGAVFAIHNDDLGFDFIANIEHLSGIFHFVAAQLRRFQRGFNIFRQGNDRAFGVHFLNSTFHHGTFVILSDILRERVGFQLLNAQRDTLTLGINREHNGFQLVAFLVLTNGFYTAFMPGNIRQVHQTIDTAFQADKDTEVSDGLNLTADLVAFGVGTSKGIPGIFLTLLHAQRNPTTLFVDVQDHYFNFFTQLHHF